MASSSIRSAGYDGEQRALEVEFQHGEIYRYEDVPSALFDELLRADSAGAFFNSHIRDEFRSQSVKE